MTRENLVSVLCWCYGAGAVVLVLWCCGAGAVVLVD
jgi:hypothetical protein